MSVFRSVSKCVLPSVHRASSVPAALMGGAPSIPATLAIFLGQSNADGHSLDPDSSTALTNGYGYEYYHSSPTGVLLPLGQVRLGRNTGGPQRAFCQTWAAGGGGPVICVDCAVGGSSMTSAYKATLTGTSDIASLSGGTWDLLDGTNLYTNYMKAHIQNAIRDVASYGFGIEHLVVYFSQGEQDSLGVSPQATYEASFRRFLDQLKIDFPTIKVLIEAIGTNQAGSNSVNSTRIRDGQIAVAADPVYSGWVTIGANLAKDFSAAGKFSDSLHYNQTGYNELGVAVATAGLAFVGSPSIVADTSPIADILSSPPAITNWQRVRIRTSKSGSWSIGFTTGGALPFITWWLDASGVNGTSAAQTTTFTFPDASAKDVYGYVSSSVGSNGSLTGQSTTSADVIEFLDSGIRLNSINFGTGGSINANAVISEASLLNLHTATFRFISASAPGTSRIQLSLSDAVLANIAQATTIVLSGAQPPSASTLSVTLIPNIGRFDYVKSGLSVSQVNLILVGLDANGLSSKIAQLQQFQASPAIAAAAPTGTGATAKTALQGKGWTVNTD